MLLNEVNSEIVVNFTACGVIGAPQQGISENVFLVSGF
jgi:hypothetical protein